MAQGYITQEKDYWIHSNALSITLNALGNANRIQCSVSSGAVVMAFIDSNTTLGYNAAHNYKSWPLTTSPTYFNTDTEKYVYVAIPRTEQIGTQAVVVFPSEKLDIDGKNAEDAQIGSTDYLYIYIHGHISEVETVEGKQQRRFISDPREHTGKLDTDQGRAEERQETEWYEWSSVMQTVTFLKKIVMSAGSWFQNIRLGDSAHNLTGVATGSTGEEYVNSETLVVTPSYLSGKYLSKTHDDTAAGEIGFLKGLWVKAKGLFGFDEDGNIKANDGVFGGILTALQAFIDKIQSSNYQSGELTGSGWQLTNDDGDGNSRLEIDNLVVRMKAVFNELEVRKYVAMGGNYVFSPAASIIERVDYLDADGELLGYEYIKVPLLARIAGRLLPIGIRNGLAKRLLTARKYTYTGGNIDMALVATFRCWIVADDGTTRTINTWHEGMLARCQTMDVAEIKGRDDATCIDNNTGAKGNVYYWRKVVGTGSGESLPVPDGKVHSRVDLSNKSGEYALGSMVPRPGDSIACFGGTKKEYSHFIIIETIGTDAPAIKEFRGVGLQDDSRDNFDGEAINWGLTDKEKTRISPTSGNRFIAPEFIVEATGERLHNENRKGTAVGFVEHDEMLITGNVGDVLLEKYTTWSATGYQIRVCTQASYIRDERIFNAVYERRHVNLGDSYVMESDRNISGNGHLFVATESGWEDKGLVTESKSSLKVGIDGITARVANSEGQISELRMEADGLTSEVRQIGGKRNLFTGLLDGSGWTLGGSSTYNPQTQTFNLIGTNGHTLNIVSPVVSVAKGTKYVISFYDTSGIETSPTIKIGTGIVTGLSWQTDEGDMYMGGYRMYVVFTAPRTGALTFSLGDSEDQEPLFSRPQMEEGDKLMPFSLGTDDELSIGSVISQKANSIDLAVMRNDIEQAGVHLNGNESKINAVANKFSIRNTITKDDALYERTNNRYEMGDVYERAVTAGETFGIDKYGTLKSPVGASIDGAVLRRQTKIVQVENNIIEFDYKPYICADWFRTIFKKKKISDDEYIYTLDNVSALCDMIVLMNQYGTGQFSNVIVWMPVAKEMVGQELTIVNATYKSKTTYPTVKLNLVDIVTTEIIAPTWAWGNTPYGFLWPNVIGNDFARTYNELDISDLSSITLRAVGGGFDAQGIGSDEETGEWVVVNAIKRETTT